MFCQSFERQNKDIKLFVIFTHTMALILYATLENKNHLRANFQISANSPLKDSALTTEFKGLIIEVGND